DRPRAVDTLQVGARGAEVADLARMGPMPQRRSIGGDVVGNELTEEGPAGRDRRVEGLDLGPPGRGATPLAEGMKCALVGLERGWIREQRAISAAFDGGVGAPRSEAVVAGDPLRAHE